MNNRHDNDNCKCSFFDGAILKHFHHFIHPTLTKTCVIADTAILHVASNESVNSEVDKDLVIENIINVAGGCVVFDVKITFISSLMFDGKRWTQLGFYWCSK